MKDQNVVFALESERRTGHLHPRSAGGARVVGGALRGGREVAKPSVLSPASARRSRVFIPPIKGVWGAQIVGCVASSPSTSTPSPPTAMSRATTRRSRRPRPSPTRRRSTVSSSATAATASRSATPRPCSGPMPPRPSRRRRGGALRRAARASTRDGPGEQGRGRFCESIRAGRPIAEVAPELAEGRALLRARPCAQRRPALDPLLARGRFRRHRRALRSRIWSGCASSRRRGTSIRRSGDCLDRDGGAAQDRENIPPNLAGEWLRAILTGAPYPLHPALDRADAAARRQGRQRAARRHSQGRSRPQLQGDGGSRVARSREQGPGLSARTPVCAL